MTSTAPAEPGTRAQPAVTRRAWLAAAAWTAAQPVRGQVTMDPLRLVIPFAAGSTIDTVGRLVAQKMSEHTGQPVVVDNRSGAGGIVGTAIVAKARPDGMTFGLVADNFSTAPAVRNDLPFDASRDLSALCMVGFVPYAVVVAADSPARSLRDLFENSRRDNQAIAYGTLGMGSHGHFIGAQIQRATAARMIPVPFKGQTEMMVAVMGGHLHMAAVNLSITLGQLQQRRVKLLATLTGARHPLTPQVATFGEAGYGPLVQNAWYGFLAPAATPVAVLEFLRRTIAAAIHAPDVSAKLSDMGIVVTAMAADRFAQWICSEIATYTRIAREANIKVE